MGISGKRSVWIQISLLLSFLFAQYSVASEYALHIKRGNKSAIVDANERTVLLRGVNLNALGDYYQANPNSPTVIPANKTDFEEMQNLGFNVVRLILSWSFLEPLPGMIDEAYLQKIHNFVDLAKAHGMYTVLDMHQDAWGKYIASDGSENCGFFEPSIGWDGAPEWATITEGLSTCRVPGLRELSPATAKAFENFWHNKNGIQDNLINVWKRLAVEFADEPAVAGYDLINEPNFGISLGWSQTFLMGKFYTKALKAIRKAERSVPGGFEHIGFFEPSAEWSAFGITLPPLGFFYFDNNIVFSPHLYSGSITITGDVASGFKHAKNIANIYRAPFWSGEWGWFGKNTESGIWEYAQHEDAYLVGGAVWSWKQACGDPHTQKVWNGRVVHDTQHQLNITYCPGNIEGGISPEYKTVISRAYPKYSPGELIELSSDPFTGELTLRGKTESPGTLSLWVPRSDRVDIPVVRNSSGEPTNPNVSNISADGYVVDLMVSGLYEVSITY